jgi:catechol 2,3-dioxygenase-like lactoylglutathione lyase family enzyme
MTLSDHPMNASVAVSDMDAATEFYEGKLQLVPERTGADGSRVYPSGGAVALHVYPSPEHAGKATATLVTWYVDDVGDMVDALVANGVEFEHYDGVLESGFDYSTDDRGISPRAGGGRIAWFQDPDGNTFAIEGER